MDGSFGRFWKLGPLPSFGKDLFYGGSIACYGGATHVARLTFIETTDPMHGLPVIPHDQVVLTPYMDIDELPLRRMFSQVANQIARLRDGPADDRTDVRG